MEKLRIRGFYLLKFAVSVTACDLVGWLVEFSIFSWETSKNMLHGYPSKKNMALKINGWKDVERWNCVLIWSLFTGAVNLLGGPNMMVWEQQFHSNTVIIGIHLKFRDLIFFEEVGNQARTWCKNTYEFPYMTHWKSLGFGSKELKLCDFLERQNSSDMVRPKKKNEHQHMIKFSRRCLFQQSHNNGPLKTCCKGRAI